MKPRRVLHVFSIIATPLAFFDGQFGFLSDNGFELHLISSPSEKGSEFARRNKAYYYPVVINRSITPFVDIKAICSIIEYIRKNEIEVVVGHTPKGALVAMLAAFFAGVKKRVYYRHGLVYTTTYGLKHFMLKEEERLVSALATSIINVSESLGALAVKDSLNRDTKQTIFGKGTCGGIDSKGLFNPAEVNPRKADVMKEKYDISNNCIVFGFVGRICRDKGIEELFEGFLLFRKRNPSLNSKLLLVGKIDDRDQLQPQIIDRLETDPYVIMTGEVEKNDMPYFYSLMDVFVFPSYREGFGMSVIEASAMEIPILVSRSHGCVDSIIEGETGLYIDISAEGICKGMESMLLPDRRRKLGLSGRERVLKEFDQTVLWPLVADYYNSLFE